MGSLFLPSLFNWDLLMIFPGSCLFFCWSIFLSTCSCLIGSFLVVLLLTVYGFFWVFRRVLHSCLFPSINIRSSSQFFLISLSPFSSLLGLLVYSSSLSVLMSESPPLSPNAHSPTLQLPLPSLHPSIPRSNLPASQSVGDNPGSAFEPPRTLWEVTIMVLIPIPLLQTVHLLLQQWFRLQFDLV